MSNKQSNDVVIDQCTTRIRALFKHVESDTVIRINGARHERAGVVAIYEDCLLARARLEALREAVREAIEERDDAEAKRREADRALKPWVVNEFGQGSEAAGRLRVRGEGDRAARGGEGAGLRDRTGSGGGAGAADGGVREERERGGAMGALDGPAEPVGRWCKRGLPP